MLDINKFWDYFLSQMKERYNEATYIAWFKDTKPVSYNEQNNELLIEVDNPVSKGFWEKKLAADLILEAYAFADLEIIPTFKVKDNQPTINSGNNESWSNEKISPDPINPQSDVNSDLRLNDRYTFETFVQGEGNKLAAGAALTIADNPGKFYNPLFIYGGVGLGKTHLMQAIAHQMLNRNPNYRVVYIQSETFVNDFINSIKNKTQEQFRIKYRTADLLLVDDIQFFANKEGIQEEFFHTFEALYNEEKQIVMTSDRLPNEIPSLSERLVSRFAWGLQVQITPPDLETRIAILRKKADAEGLDVDEETLNYIASQVDTNIRNLEGALVRVQAHATISRRDINVDLAKDALRDLKLVQSNRGLEIAKIQEVVANYYQTSTTELKGKKRTKNIVVPRQIAMYLARELTDNSLPKIGQEFGGKDHTTVMHACEKIAKEMKVDSSLKNEISDLSQILQH